MGTSAPANPLLLSDSAVVLLAANLAAVPHLPALLTLITAYPQVLHFRLVLDILLKILPETTSPEDYLPIVHRLYRHEASQTNDVDQIPAAFVQKVSNLSEQAARRKLALFQLDTRGQNSAVEGEEEEALLNSWYFNRARRVEEATGMIDLARRLVCPDTNTLQQTPPFPPSSVTIWGKGVVRVLETFIFDSDDEDELRLVAFESLDSGSAIRLLLSRTTPETVSTTLRRLILPFTEYVRSKEPERNTWETVWDWLLDRAIDGELQYISNLANNWIEADNVILKEFLRISLAACYLCRKTSSSIRSYLQRIHEGILHLSQRLDLPQSAESIPLQHTETDLLATELRISSPLTNVTRSAFEFLAQMIKSAEILAQYSIELSLSDLIFLQGANEEAQAQLLNRVLRSDQAWKMRNEAQWKQLRSSMKWLQNNSRVLGKISQECLDKTILTAMLDASAFGLARETFVRGHVLPAEILERTVLEVFYRFYDNATNGNRTRGGIKNAFQTLQVLDDPSTTPSTSHAVKLVSATHNLSHYALSLTPGIAITPAQIRMHKDPALLVCKVIDTNPSLYHETDRMVKILDDLIEGIQLLKDTPGRETEMSKMHARVYAAILKAAVHEHDFMTAYQICINKLAPLTTQYVDDTINDVAWQAYDLAGSYSSRTLRPSPQTDFHKMELLAQAILICPKSEIVGILKKWSDLERKSLQSGEQAVQTPLQTPAMSRDNKSLLATAAQVGRSVARTASPLLGDGHELGMERREDGWASSTSRFGVRDTVKTGLTQGIGWLLGATPQRTSQEEEQR